MYMNTDKMKHQPSLFENPPSSYGEVAFFWWNGEKITKEKLTWILQQLHGKHIHALQINYGHTNYGGEMNRLTLPADPPVFSEEWWELIEWFTDECKKYDMVLGMSDYTLWYPENHFYRDQILSEHPEMIGQRLIMAADGTVVIEKVPYSTNPIASGIGAQIIDRYYAEFERRMPGKCGKELNYFFTDELHFGVDGNLWSDDFQNEFQKRKGYDIIEKLTAIFRDIGPETPKIRLDYYDVIVQLIEERYFRPIYEWHEERGMTFGCDYRGRGRRMTEFGDYFRTLKWYQAPGNDQAFLVPDIIKSKVSSSAAHLNHRPRVWLEGFCCSGWDTGSDDVADAVFRGFMLGHNLLSLHGLYYTTKGSMWEWAPPCNHYHMPYWGQMEHLLACTKRLSYLLSQGTHCCDAAVVYPVAAAEADYDRGTLSAETAFSIAEDLYSHGIDFDFIDFESINRSLVQNGQLYIAGEAYRTIIVPEMFAVRFSMVEKLLEFASSGGLVIFLKCLPESSDRIGRDDSVLNTKIQSILKYGKLVQTNEDVISLIRHFDVPDFVCEQCNPFFQHRRIDGEDYYFIYNVAHNTELRFRAKGYPVLLDPWNGGKKRITQYQTITESIRDELYIVTILQMPLSEKEMCIILMESDRDEWERLDPYRPCAENDVILHMDGEWQCMLKPTMDNAFGDWRLPASDSCIGAEARLFEYDYSDDNRKPPENADWKSSLYSFGTYFWYIEGSSQEEAMISMKKPLLEMKPYRFSMRFGVEGDAGDQKSFHGLKGYLSDEFLVMGEKRVGFLGAPSTYVGEGPYYFFTTVYIDEITTVRIESAEYSPDKIWLDHQETECGEITLSPGRHYILLRYPHGGKSYFVLKKSDAFTQTVPLATQWFQNTDIIAFDAIPREEKAYCWYKFRTPPGASRMTVTADIPIHVFCDGDEVLTDAHGMYPLRKYAASKEIMICAKQSSAIYDTAIFDDPITFQTEKGCLDLNKSLDEQGLEFYSGGICLWKIMQITDIFKHHYLKLDRSLGCAFSITVNGCDAGVSLASPYLIDITEHLVSGDNTVMVTAFSTMYNHMKSIPTDYNYKRGNL